MRIARRRWLAQAGALASAAAFPFRIPIASAQSQSTLNALPRLALVIGNTKYVEAPLKNPGNDAKAIAGELQKLGFQINLRLDAGRSEMLDAIRAFGTELAKRKSIGLFYYAGHGAQLAWRNYLIPVDAEIEKLDDMQTRAVELTALLEGLIKAQNPMNVIILDACRDNPFGNKVQTGQKGLSQFDAPPGSLLAYATSPGNVAADGEGANGLYTENLLRELKTPEAKIEDVFKRVRLNVRLKSGGRQIPWETTSLEEDFYFLPPQQVRKLSEAELKKQFDEEFAIWEKIKVAKEPAPLEDYLRNYPSGRFAELAQFQLDRVLARQGEKKIEIVSVAANPFSKGTARTDTNVRLGDFYTYRILDLYTKLETSSFTEVVTAITDTEIEFSNGERVTDFLGNNSKDREGRRSSGNQTYVAEYSIGKKWTTRFLSTGPQGQGKPTEVEIDFKVVARENITVAAGTFDAYKVEGQGWVLQFGVQLQWVYWIAPDKSRRPVVVEFKRRHIGGKVLIADRYELVAFKQGG
jgi:hypothetical protein